MTYKIKNATIVFAFAAVLLAWPMAASNVHADIVDANMNVECGFSTTNLAAVDFGNFVPTDTASTVGEEEIQLTGNGASSARVFLTVEDWVTIGTRASGTITLLAADAADSVTVGTQTYDAVASATSGTDWDQRGDDAADAFELASVIRATDAANFKVSTGGTAVVTVNTVARGTAANGAVLSEDTTGSTIITRDSAGVTTENDMDGAVSTALSIMNGDTTKFDILVGGTTTDTYANKRSITTVGTAEEVLGGTTEENIFFALMIDPASATFAAAALPYDGAVTQDITIAVDSACDGT